MYEKKAKRFVCYKTYAEHDNIDERPLAGKHFCRTHDAIAHEIITIVMTEISEFFFFNLNL